MKKNLKRTCLALFTCLITLASTPVFADDLPKKHDLNGDGILDQIILHTHGFTPYLCLIDGVTRKELAKVEVYPDRSDSPSVTISTIDGYTFIDYFAWDGQPWSALLQYKDNKLTNLASLSQTSVNVSYATPNQVTFSFPSLPGWEQSFKLSASHYKELKSWGSDSWYPSSNIRLSNNKLTIESNLHFPSIDNSEHIQVVEEYTFSQGKWTLQKALCTSYDTSVFSPVKFTPPSSSIKLTIDGTPITDPNLAPIKQGSVTMVPIRVITNYLKGDLTWNNPHITLTKGSKKLELSVGSKTASINSKQTTLEAAPFIKNGVTFVPVRIVAEALDAKVDWLQATQTVALTSTGTTTPSETSSPYAMIGQGYLDFLDLTMGTPMSQITSKLGTGEGDELAPENTRYSYSYNNNGNFFILDFDKDDICIQATFLSR